MSSAAIGVFPALPASPLERWMKGRSVALLWNPRSCCLCRDRADRAQGEVRGKLPAWEQRREGTNGFSSNSAMRLLLLHCSIASSWPSSLHSHGGLLSPASRAQPGPKRVQRYKQGPATKGRGVHVGRAAQSNIPLQSKPPHQALCDGGKERGRAKRGVLVLQHQGQAAEQL